MLEYKEIRYAAIITISLPDGAEARYQITLAPPDQVNDGSGKALRDCTLAELQAYAQALETEVWTEWQDKNLVDLAKSAEMDVVVKVINDTGAALPPKASLLAHIVLVPEKQGEDLTAAQMPAAVTQTPGPNSESLAAVVADTDEQEQPVDETVGGDSVIVPAEQSLPADPTVDPGKGKAALAEEAAQSSAPIEAEPESNAETRPDALLEPDGSPILSEIDAPAITDDSPTDAPAEPSPATPKRLFRIAGRRRILGAKTWTAADILINEPAFRDAQAHALTSMQREVAGMLIGPPPEQKEDGRWIVHVTDSMIAKHTEMRGASVTYTPESWRYIHDRLAERYPDEEAVIVGWYHTHPGFGIFLSGMDLFIHQNFFVQPWHIALVLDPQARRSGFFCWDSGQTQVRPYDFPWPNWARTRGKNEIFHVH